MGRQEGTNGFFDVLYINRVGNGLVPLIRGTSWQRTETTFRTARRWA